MSEEKSFSFTFITSSETCMADTEWMFACDLRVREFLSGLKVEYDTFSGDVDVDGPTTLYTVGFTVTKNAARISDEYIAEFNQTHPDVDLERAEP